MTEATPSPFLVSALGKITGAVPVYTLSVTRETRIGSEGLLRVEDPAKLKAAMDDWRRLNAGYEPRIYADKEDPCLATWSRWNTCA